MAAEKPEPVTGPVPNSVPGVEETPTWLQSLGSEPQQADEAEILEAMKAKPVVDSQPVILENLTQPTAVAETTPSPVVADNSGVGDDIAAKLGPEALKRLKGLGKTETPAAPASGVSA